MSYSMGAPRGESKNFMQDKASVPHSHCGSHYGRKAVVAGQVVETLFLQRFVKK